MFSSELRSKIFQYLNAEIIIGELEDWYTPRLPEFLEDADSPDADVISVILHGLTEMDDGIQTEDEFKEVLKSVLDEYSPTRYVTYGDQSIVTTSSSNQTSELPYIYPVTVFSIQPEVVEA